jgi:hypothetical protein
MKTLMICWMLVLIPAISLSDSTPRFVDLLAEESIQTWTQEGPVLTCPSNGCPING